MAGGHHGDPGGEIQKTVAVGVFDDGAFAPLRNQRIGAGVGRRDNLLIPLDDGFRVWARERSEQIEEVVHLKAPVGAHLNANTLATEKPLKMHL